MDDLYKQIVSFQRRVNDWLDDRSSAAARSLQQEVQRLEDDAQVRKNPDSIESRVKSVMRLLEQAADQGAMSHHHADELVDQCEDFRRTLQKLG